jgi:hypothetical protein
MDGRLLVVGIAVCLAAVARSQDSSTLRKCTEHNHCHVKQGEYCSADRCTPGWEGFELPCGHCRPCSACKCHSNSFDGVCPSHCPSPANEVRLQGIFVNTDVQGDGSTCLQIWTFEGKSFRRHDTGLTHQEAYRTTYYMQPWKHYASTQTLMPPKKSACKLNNESGTFTFERSPSGSMSRFGLKLWKPTFAADSSQSYDVEILDCASACPDAISCSFADGTSQVLAESVPTKIFAGGAEPEPPRYAEMLDGTPYLGTISMFDTVCKISMRFFSAGKPGLVYFIADTGACEIGTAKAPDMPNAEWAGENQDKLRRGFPSNNASAHEPEQDPGRATRTYNEISGDPRPAVRMKRGRRDMKIVNISHYDFSNGSVADMTICADQRYNISECALPKNHSASRCIQYPIQQSILTSLNLGIGPWEYPSDLSQYDCRCEVGFLDISCKKSLSGVEEEVEKMSYLEVTEELLKRHISYEELSWSETLAKLVQARYDVLSTKCGNASTALLRTWPTTHYLYEDKSCICGISCVDIDECALDLDNCHPQARCNNTHGSFTCSCNRGFEGPGVSCADDQECLDHTHDCHKHATCINTYGSFECACNQGLSGNGKYCNHTSNVLVERVWSSSQKLQWEITWHIETKPHAMDLVSIYKGSLPSSRLVNFFFNSAVPCNAPATCVSDDFGRGAFLNKQNVVCLTYCRVLFMK